MDVTAALLMQGSLHHAEEPLPDGDHAEDTESQADARQGSPDDGIHKRIDQFRCHSEYLSGRGRQALAPAAQQ